MHLLTNSDFKTLFETTPDAYVVFKPDLTVVAFNNAYLKAVDIDPKAIIGKKLGEVFPDNPSHASGSVELIRASVNRTIESGEPCTAGIMRYDIARSDGTFEKRFWRTLFVPVFNNENKISWVIGKAEDVTEMMILNEEKLQWQKKFSQNNCLAEELRLLSGHLHNTREKERAHIAREVHDELGQQLSVIKMQISWLFKKLDIADESLKATVTELMETINGTITSVRRISAELRPSILDDMGVVAAIEWQLMELKKKWGIRTYLSGLNIDPPLGDIAKINLFRIVQESLTNVARHANAKNIWLTLQQQATVLILSIKDDGIGFKQDTLSKRTFGLISMKERTRMLGGKYDIKSSPRQGTTITVTMPLHMQNREYSGA
ncbi:MAG: sensor histidine kinase [Agriterribacter sp.]